MAALGGYEKGVIKEGKCHDKDKKRKISFAEIGKHVTLLVWAVSAFIERQRC